MLDRTRVRELYLEVAELPDHQRPAFLDRVCGGDAALRAEVESLVAAAARRPAFMNSPTAAPTSPDAIGIRIGPYHLLQEIGQGGFGAVYMAEQQMPVRRRVALKIIKLGMDTRAVIARFEAERQALAMMDHPNIARVFDAGVTDTGRPYFVMELVRGEPMTAYCDRHNLSVPERLGLFIQVCHAVQHAHSKGVIHRDLKPGNILVATEDGRPHAKVIDFGIAKATDQRLTERTVFTNFGQFIGTPEYMSPEQAEGSLNLDTRSDVYSLGILLYELLTGATPFDAAALRSAAYAEMQRIIREVEPPKPSTRLSNSKALAEIAARRRAAPQKLSLSIRGDLDWIVMRALEKDRSRRYDTASGLAADLARHLAGEPVDAAPPSRAYRAAKFVRRHRAAVTAAALLAGALMLGISGTSVGLILAQASARRAQREADRADNAAAEATRRREAAEYESYIANIESAYGALVLNEPARLRKRLDACPPERRQWEWWYLNAASDNSLLSMRHPRRNVSRLSLSPDGARIVTSSGDGKVRIWDAGAGTELAVLSGPSRFWGDAEFSPDGQHILAPAVDGRIWLWDAATRAEVSVLAGHDGKVHRALFATDDCIISACDDGTGRIWEVASGRARAVLRGHTGPVLDIAATADGARIATAGADGTARVWDGRTGEQTLLLSGHSGPLRSVRWSPDAGRLVTASEDGAVRVWDTGSGREVSRFSHNSRVLWAIFAPDGSGVLSGAIDGTPRLWDPSTGQERLALLGHTHLVWGAAYSPDGGSIVTHSADNTVRLWDSRTGKERVCFIGHVETPWAAKFSPDGRRIYTGGDFTVRVWAAGAGPSKDLIADPVSDSNGIRLSPDERWLLESGVGRVRLIETATGRVVNPFPGANIGPAPAEFSPDGSRVAAALDDSSVAAWDVHDGRIALTLRGHEDAVNCIRFSADEARIVTASDDGTARIWDSATGAEVHALRGHTGSVLCASFDPAGSRVVTACEDKLVRVWDASSGRLIRELAWHEHAVIFACFSPDGARLLSSGADYTSRVWDAATGDRLLKLDGHEHIVLGGMFSADGRRIVTSSFDGTARLWDADTGRQVLSISGRGGGLHTARFTPDGTRLLLGSVDGRAWMLDTVPFRERAALPAGRPGASAR